MAKTFQYAKSQDHQVKANEYLPAWIDQYDNLMPISFIITTLSSVRGSQIKLE